jgi:hypothetical protein
MNYELRIMNESSCIHLDCSKYYRQMSVATYFWYFGSEPVPDLIGDGFVVKNILAEVEDFVQLEVEAQGQPAFHYPGSQDGGVEFIRHR